MKEQDAVSGTFESVKGDKFKVTISSSMRETVTKDGKDFIKSESSGVKGMLERLIKTTESESMRITEVK